MRKRKKEKRNSPIGTRANNNEMEEEGRGRKNASRCIEQRYYRNRPAYEYL